MQVAVLDFPLEHARFDLRTQNSKPPFAGSGNPCMAPQSAPRGARSNAQQRRFRPQTPDRSRPQKSTRIRIRSSKCYPPLLGQGRSCGSFAARLGIRVPRPPRSETKLFRTSSCGSGIPLLRPIGSLEPLLCCAEGVIGAPVCSVRSGGPGPAIARTRSGLLGRWAAAMVVLREAREWTPTAIELHDGAWGPFICPSR